LPEGETLKLTLGKPLVLRVEKSDDKKIYAAVGDESVVSLTLFADMITLTPSAAGETELTVSPSENGAGGLRFPVLVSGGAESEKPLEISAHGADFTLKSANG
jgi:hypothetical protein